MVIKNNKQIVVIFMEQYSVFKFPQSQDDVFASMRFKP